ncbi:LacI family DNA-binding transcriptional regulator [Paractinoplanes lichenicola]|uniref:LacI family DNA-binding transcriptional regulator n=1 Tax=Paractinoplanes lichenicola TaxID=2802976 RepID=A0ABS1W4Q9_9ACTN|nr:LacI family DNA-binding transcriptional regulator [Actinoplanes lichenicola]MBL7261672.1 LacI family DNA-binding transcriptional regulator [Actinoplanes lichenicola]
MSESTTKRVTSADVARLAGVSRATVSYVLNDTPRQTISAGTRTRVLDAAARLGYSPSAAARTLRTGRSDVVLCLLPDWPIGPEVGSMLGRLSSALTRHGLTLVVHPGNREERPMTELWKAITPAAVIAYTEFSEADITAMRSAGVAIVEAVSRRKGRSLAVPQELVGRRQAEHLTQAGHTRLGFAYPDDERVRFFAEPRLAGVRAACAGLRLPTPVGLTVPLDPAAAAEAVRRWRATGVTAVCAYNDEVALAVLAGVRGEGLTVPDDLAVIGVDDIPPARLADPPLTTVTTDQTVVGAHLAATVVAAISGRAAPDLPAADIVRVVRRVSA